ncbi:class F sortase [Catellatospora sp. KI3]|uniref:class F sortase n=1 Tax=Catellatospora sp. KI3 TaxID=3041620 RepID=UPI002482AA04|nr:class F sortase [Catellatospora sp. KI3]MDI1462488.1 class F sortase [Catellatospora sp. KI3]
MSTQVPVPVQVLLGRHRAGGRRRDGRVPATALVLLCALAGLVLLAAAFLTAPKPPPQPAADGGRYQAGDTDRRPDARGVRPMERSVPVRVRIPAIDVDAVVVTVGTNTDGTLQVPELTHADLTGWYRYGPSPGERGNAVIVGHVDTRASGPAVFYDLGRLASGTRVEVVRMDGTVAVFSVVKVRSFPKAEFPATRVYGTSDDMGLRLVTCGGAYDATQRGYLSSTVVFAALTGTERAG